MNLICVFEDVSRSELWIMPGWRVLCARDFVAVPAGVGVDLPLVGAGVPPALGPCGQSIGACLEQAQPFAHGTEELVVNCRHWYGSSRKRERRLKYRAVSPLYRVGPGVAGWCDAVYDVPCQYFNTFVGFSIMQMTEEDLDRPATFRDFKQYMELLYRRIETIETDRKQRAAERKEASIQM